MSLSSPSVLSQVSTPSSWWRHLLPRTTLRGHAVVILAGLGFLVGALIVLGAEQQAYDLMRQSQEPTGTRYSHGFWTSLPTWAIIVVGIVLVDTLLCHKTSQIRTWWREQGNVAAVVWCLVPAFIAGTVFSYAPWTINQDQVTHGLYATAKLPTTPEEDQGREWFDASGQFKAGLHEGWCIDTRARLGLYEQSALSAWSTGSRSLAEKLGTDLRTRAWTMGCLSDREFMESARHAYQKWQKHGSTGEIMSQRLHWLVWLPQTDVTPNAWLTPQDVCRAAHGYELLAEPAIRHKTAATFARCDQEFSSSLLATESDIQKARLLWQDEFAVDYASSRSREGFIGHPYTKTPESWGNHLNEKAP
jgi:hypothetical protein